MEKELEQYEVMTTPIKEPIKEGTIDEEEIVRTTGKRPEEITAERGRIIRKIKDEINKIKSKEKTSDEEKQMLEQLELRLDDTLQDHRNQIADRYDKEFIKEKATFKSLVTILPKAVGLSAKKVATCIDELKNAKGNKAKIFKSIELVKSIGLFLGTPFIYTVKFIANHWYLLLLLLALLKLPNFKPGKNNQNQNQQQQEQEQEQPEHATETEHSPVHVPTADEVRNEQRDLRPHPVHHPAPVPAPVDQDESQVHVPTAEETRAEQRDLRPHPSPTPADANQAHSAAEAQPLPDISEKEILHPLTEDELESVRQIYNDFMKALNDNNYRVLIEDQCPDVTFVHNAQEFIDYVKSINPTVNITEDNALRIYEQTTNMMTPEELQVYWINSGTEIDPFHYFATTKEFADKIASGEIPALTEKFTNFVDSGNIDPGLFDIVNSGISDLSTALGISVEAATALFIIYEIAQYGAAPFTGGMSLALPG